MTSKKLHILVPTDFSNNAWTATVYALKLYVEEACTFYFLNSTSLSHADSRSYITTKFLDNLNETSNRELKELQERAATISANAEHDFELISTNEDITPAVRKAVKHYKIDLVVAGTKGATGVNKYFLGSNTVKIIQNLEACPMLAVPNDYQFRASKHIAFPTNFNKIYESKELQSLFDLANLYNAHIYVLHINTKDGLSGLQESNMRALQNHLEDYEHTFHWMEKTGTKSDEINEFVEDFKIDVLAMVNYKHSFVESIIKEPVIKKIGFQPMVPFFVIPG